MKITESISLASLGVSGRTQSGRPVPAKPGPEAASGTELSLNSASQAVFEGRPERVAELRSLVGSGDYKPQTEQVAGKMVDSALVRQE